MGQTRTRTRTRTHIYISIHIYIHCLRSSRLIDSISPIMHRMITTNKAMCATHGLVLMGVVLAALAVSLSAFPTRRPCEALGTCDMLRPTPNVRRPPKTISPKLSLKNCMRETYSFSIGYRRGDKWVSKGHYNVQPGRTRTYTFPSYTDDRPLYFRYYRRGQSLTGSNTRSGWKYGSFCMSSGAFHVEEDADNKQIYVERNTARRGRTGSLGRRGCTSSNGLSWEKFLEVSKSRRGRDQRYNFWTGCSK